MSRVTAKSPQGARIPITVDNDRQAIQIALASCLKIQPATSRIMRIRDTKHVETFWASESLLSDILEEGRVSQTGDLREIAFDAAGMLVD